jgi:hypothetical protein
MNEQLVMDLAENITWLVFFCLISGLLIGWYATFTYYRQKERERKAVEDYKREERVKFPPKSDLQRAQDAMNELQRIVTRYHVEWDTTHWDFDDDVEEKEDEQ